MKTQEFNRVLKTILRTGPGTTEKRIDPEKAAGLDIRTKAHLTYFLVMSRAPVLVELLPHDVDRAWLGAMGYLYTTTGAVSGLRFVHTVEHDIK